jgi:signal recognition particle subunit SRP54
LRDVRLALLEADVALPIVKQFIASVREKALGQEVVGSLTPGQALVGIVQRELTTLMGEAAVPLNLATAPPAVVLLAGLQGSGKTTSAAKLARRLRDDLHRKVLLASCDVYRPAAMAQLAALAAQIGVPYFEPQPELGPVEIATAALAWARTHYYDTVIVDTAGRLAIDEAMMHEISALHATLKPVETLFVVDAMQGQDAVNTARAFAATLPLTGIVLTKLDGDARGGAALSVRQATGAPIKFAGVSEKPDGLEVFHPDRMAARILGMGDMLTFIEEAHRQVDRERTEKIARKIKAGKSFDLDDFRLQIVEMRKLGGLQGLLDKLPAQLAATVQGAQVASPDDRSIRRLEAIINSMTPAERAHPELLKASRKRRVAAGAGASVQDVNRLLKQFEQAQKVMKAAAKGGLQQMLRGLRGTLPGLR